MKICIAFQSIAANEMNGDFILQKKIAGGTLVLLADGMGGLDFPEQASKIVCEAILDYFESYNASVPSKIIQESLEYADKTLRKACYQRKCKTFSIILHWGMFVYIMNTLMGQSHC